MGNLRLWDMGIIKEKITPTGWKETTLGEAVGLIKDSWKPGDEDTHYLGLEHINENDLTINSIGTSGKLGSNKFRFRSGDILFGKLRPYFRKVVVPDFDGICSTDIWVMRVKEGFNQKFLFYFMANPVLVAQSTGASTGTKMPRADWGYLSNNLWSFPPLPEQKEIAGVLSSLDDKIELLRKQNETLEQIARTNFHEWFVEFNFPNEKGQPHKASGGKMIESELGEIPEGWKVETIKDHIDILSGYAFKSADFDAGGKYGLVTIKNVQSGYFVEQTTDRLELLPDKMPKYCQLKTGDILLSLTGNVGRICYVVGEGYLLNQRVAKIKAKDEKDFAFAYLYFRQETFLETLENVASGTAQQNLSPIKTGELNIMMPSRSVLDSFSHIASPMINKMFQNSLQIQQLASVRDVLLPKLMSGEIRVKI